MSNQDGLTGLLDGRLERETQRQLAMKVRVAVQRFEVLGALEVQVPSRTPR